MTNVPARLALEFVLEGAALNVRLKRVRRMVSGQAVSSAPAPPFSGKLADECYSMAGPAAHVQHLVSTARHPSLNL